MGGHEINARITALLNKRFTDLKMDYWTFQQMTGFRPARITKLLQGGAWVRLEWVETIAGALQIDSREMMLLALKQHFDEEAFECLERILLSASTSAELSWLDLIRYAASDDVAEPTDLQRRVLIALLTSADGLAEERASITLSLRNP